MSGSSFVRAIGWSIVGLLILTIIAAGALLGRPPEPPEPTADEVAQLARLPDARRAAALSELRDRLSQNGRDCQVLVVRAAPVGPPLVVANVTDSDGDEEATHWTVPWKAVAEALHAPPADALTVAGEYAGIHYRHRLIPLDPSGTCCLLINLACEPAGWRGLRGLCLLAAALLTGTLMVTRPAD